MYPSTELKEGGIHGTDHPKHKRQLQDEMRGKGGTK